MEQLYKKQNGQYIKVYPLNYIENILDSESGKTLASILSNFNNISLPYQDNAQDTRALVPQVLRRKGLWITYNNGEDYITEYYKGTANDIQEHWTDDYNWEVVPSLKYVQENAGKLPDGIITPSKLSPALLELIKQNNTITNLPDDEDLEEFNSVLRFKDRSYQPELASGKGYKILRKNWTKVGDKTINLLTQDMINEPNTRYVIQYDFDLNEQEITIPEGCILDFQGGSFKRGILLGTNIANEYVDLDWFGAYNNEEKNSLDALSMCIKFANSVHKDININGQYIFECDTDINIICNQNINFNDSKIIFNTKNSNTFKITIENSKITYNDENTVLALIKLINKRLSSIYEKDINGDYILNSSEISNLEKLKDGYIQIYGSQSIDEIIETNRLSTYNIQSFLQTENLFIDKYGGIDPSHYYNESLIENYNYYKINYYPNNSVYLKGGDFIYKGNTTTMGSHSYKNIGFDIIGFCNVLVENIKVNLSNFHNRIYSFIAFKNIYNGYIHNISAIQASHDENLDSSYIFNLYDSYHIILEDISSPCGYNDYWGHIVSHRCSDIIFEHCIIKRIDSHYRGFDYVINNCRIIGDTINFCGGGIWKINNTTLYGSTFLKGRGDYASEFDGDIYIDNCRLIDYKNIYNDAFIIDISVDIANKILHPNNNKSIPMIKNIYINNFYVNKNKKSGGNIYSLYIRTGNNNQNVILPNIISINNIVNEKNINAFIPITVADYKSLLSYNFTNNGLENIIYDEETYKSYKRNSNFKIYINNINNYNFTIDQILRVRNSATSFEEIFNSLDNNERGKKIMCDIFIHNVNNISLSYGFIYDTHYYIKDTYIKSIRLSEENENSFICAPNFIIDNCTIDCSGLIDGISTSNIILSNSIFTYTDSNSNLTKFIFENFGNIPNYINYNISNCKMSQYLKDYLNEISSEHSAVYTIENLDNFFKKGYLLIDTTSENIAGINVWERFRGNVKIYIDGVQVDYKNGNISYKAYSAPAKFNTIGSSLERPEEVNASHEGFMYYDKTMVKPIYWNGTNWTDAIGNNVDIKYSGTTEQRPIDINIGFRYFDTDLNKPIYWTGSKWVDATGEDV